MAHLRADYGYDASLIVAGPIESSVEHELRREAVALNIAENIENRGELGPDGIAALLETAHALVVPSIWEEPACLAPRGGGAGPGSYLVASRSGGIPELVRDRLDGLLFSRGDAEQCAELLAETLADPEATRGRVESAFERAQQWSFQPYVEATDRFLERTMRAFEAQA